MVRGIALALASEKARGECYNIGNPKTRTYVLTVQKITSLMGTEVEIVRVPDWFLPQAKRSKSCFAQHIMSDTTKIRDHLGYAEKYALDEGFLNTIAWTKENPPASWKEDFSYEEEDALMDEFAKLTKTYADRS